MPTSGDTTWTLTAQDIISQALCDELGVFGFGESVTAEAQDHGLRHLIALMKSCKNSAHLESTGTVTIPAASASGTLGANVGEVVSARVVETGGNERQLVRYERDDYLILPDKTASGAPAIFYVSDQRDEPLCYVWPVPTTDTTLKIDYRRIPETVTAVSQTVDFPNKYLPALIASLAVRCAGRFGVKPGDRPELFARAQVLWQEMQDDERPVSYMLGAI